MGQPCYLIVKTGVSNAKFREFRETNNTLCSRAAGMAGTQETVALEPGSVPKNIMAVRFDSAEKARASWQESDQSALSSDPDLLVMVSIAVPEEGFPPELDFLPTHKNTGVDDSSPPALMLIEGSVWDEQPIDAYRDIIMPMLKERKAFYLIYALAEDIQVLQGQWSEGFLALSRWPTQAAAYDFWLSDTYQNKAIPTRIDAGKFSVLLLQGEQDHF